LSKESELDTVQPLLLGRRNVRDRQNALQTLPIVVQAIVAVEEKMNKLINEDTGLRRESEIIKKCRVAERTVETCQRLAFRMLLRIAVRLLVVKPPQHRVQAGK